jgi:DNA repair protein RadC
MKDTTYNIVDHDSIIDGTDKEYILRVKDLDSDLRPREKILKNGPEILESYELLAILLNTGSKKEDILSMSRRLLKEYGEKTLICEKNPIKISKEQDIPLIKACQIVACFELGRRFFGKRGGKSRYIKTAKQAFEYLKELQYSKKEHLVGIYLNSRYQIVHEETISIGSLTSSVIHPREVFAPALEHMAVAVIIAHNHPSGVLKPTKSDIGATKRLINAGDVIGISLLDHIIVAENKFISLIEGSYLDEK